MDICVNLATTIHLSSAQYTMRIMGQLPRNATSINARAEANACPYEGWQIAGHRTGRPLVGSGGAAASPAGLGAAPRFLCPNDLRLRLTRMPVSASGPNPPLASHRGRFTIFPAEPGKTEIPSSAPSIGRNGNSPPLGELPNSSFDIFARENTLGKRTILPRPSTSSQSACLSPAKSQDATM